MAATSTPCIFFQQGRCRNGDVCRFSHSSDLTSPPASDARLRRDPRSQVPCKFYLEGICKQGVVCPYSHDPSSSTSSALPHSQHDNDTFVRVFRGALVRYGDGACVTNLTLPSEYSSVRLDGLAADTTATDVITILEDLGHEVEVDGLRIVAAPQSSLCSAYINTPDLEFSKTLSASLINTSYQNLKAVPVPPRLPSWASTRRARCNKLYLSWHPPFKKCALYFAARATALRVSRKFNTGKYKIFNTRITGEDPESEQGSPDIWSVTLSKLPCNCTEELVEDAITADYDAPFYVSMQPQTACERDPELLVREFLRGMGPIDSMPDPYEHNGKFTVFAQFKQDVDAQEAARLIEKESHKLPPDLTAKLLYSSTFKMSKEVYHHVQHRLRDALKDTQDASEDKLHAPRTTVTPQGSSIILGLGSWSPEEVAKCANIVEDIVAGDVIEGKDGSPFWVPQLASNGSASKLLKEKQKRHGALLLPNRSKREVRYFGDSSKRIAVQEDVVQSLTEDLERRHTIDIDDADYLWLCQTGLDLLKAVVGDTIASLSVASGSKKLIVTGSDEEYCEVLALLEIGNVSFAKKEARSEESCSVCFTPADDPVVLGCGHTYCADCFKALCKNSTTQTDTKVTCTGAEDKCKNAIPLREIQAHTDPSAFEHLLETSFSTYISRRPDQFHYCPTPDCGYIYRPGRAASGPSLWHMCPKCLQRICRSCHVNHDGQRCGELRAFQTFEAYKRENRSNVKDCPKCKTTVEKIDGCNHIQCGGCSIHICWACLEVFEKAQSCYTHMTEVHGGIGIVDPEEDEDDDVNDDVNDDDDDDEEDYEDHDE